MLWYTAQLKRDNGKCKQVSIIILVHTETFPFSSVGGCGDPEMSPKDQRIWTFHRETQSKPNQPIMKGKTLQIRNMVSRLRNKSNHKTGNWYFSRSQQRYGGQDVLGEWVGSLTLSLLFLPTTLENRIEYWLCAGKNASSSSWPVSLGSWRHVQTGAHPGHTWKAI